MRGEFGNGAPSRTGEPGPLAGSSFAVSGRRAHPAGPNCLEPMTLANGTLRSSDKKRTWNDHGKFCVLDRNDGRGWARNNIVELLGVQTVMVIRPDRLGGDLYGATSKDGGRNGTSFLEERKSSGSRLKVTTNPLRKVVVVMFPNPNPSPYRSLAIEDRFEGMQS